MADRLEREFQAEFINELRERYPEAIILKNDSGYQQGIPDWIMLVDDRWFMFEIKRSPTAPLRPNQGYYVDLCNEMSFAAFVYPQNKEQVLDALSRSLRTRR
jgi:hypothetical protein